ncbi:MAG: transcriptional repressor, partial [Clostridium sp.]|nr:transcriptional repressor [Clostridium sp.]
MNETNRSGVTELRSRLEMAGIKPTPNRVLVARELAASEAPLSLGELETRLETLEKSSILRVLNMLLDRHLLHALEDGRGVVKYELCHHDHRGDPDDEPDSDIHVHFYCERCNRVVCFEDIPVPHVDIPVGYDIRSVNFMLKGICPDC